MAWDLGEAEALLLERMLRAGDADNALEQGWFLRELRIRFGLSGEELSKRFGRTPSWVSSCSTVPMRLLSFTARSGASYAIMARCC